MLIARLKLRVIYWEDSEFQKLEASETFHGLRSGLGNIETCMPPIYRLLTINFFETVCWGGAMRLAILAKWVKFMLISMWLA